VFFLPAICLSGLFFIAWDIVFTARGVWSFNPEYLSGIYLFGLPLEEYLFFICIPYACIYTYTFIQCRLRRYRVQVARAGMMLTWLLIPGLTLVAILYYGQLYTFVTAISFLAFLLWLTRSRYIIHAGFVYLAYIPLLIPFYLVDGTLTGMFTAEPVVLYDNLQNSGIRWATIPVEDILYGLFLISSTAVLHEFFELASTTRLTGRKAFLKFGN
jgi:lycopene cyclase domain-containing protein